MSSLFPTRNPVLNSILSEKLLSKEILPNGFGIGILNVHKRLELAFGDACSLEFINEENFATVKITVPDRNGGKKEKRTCFDY